MEIIHQILIVDDNDTNVYSLRRLLERLEVVIHTASSGFEAIELTEKNSYSLILLDIQMPEMDGFETLQAIRQIPGRDEIPIILISAIYTEDQYKLKGLENGAIDFIPKPVNPEVIRSKVKVFLEFEENRLKLKKLIGELKDKNRQLAKEVKARKLVEQELRIARNKAEKNSEIKTQLLVNMSHEIRTPINSILGFADLITNPNVTDRDKVKYLKYVSSSSHNLLFLIDEILEQSRLDSGEIKPVYNPCAVSDLMVELLELFGKIKNQSNKEHISLVLDDTARDSNLTIVTDPLRLRQIITNLLTNAIKYTKEGSIHFGFVKLETEVEFYVSDTGIGISQEDQKDLFTQFRRFEEQTDLRATGTGLGLSLARRLTEMLGGTIQVRSELNQGSTFSVTLPLVQANNIPKSLIELHDILEEVDWSDYTLLVAEDEEMNFLFLQEALRSTSIKIIWARNGTEAIDMVKKHKIDVVLMDVKMPDMDGYESSGFIKGINPDLPVIMQTAFAFNDEAEKQNKKFYDDFLTKPINRKHLIGALSRFLKQ